MTENRWLTDDQNRHQVHVVLKCAVQPIGAIYCTMRKLPDSHPDQMPETVALDHAMKVIWSMAWHANAADALNSARGVLYELAMFITEVVGANGHMQVDDYQDDEHELECGHTPAEHAQLFHYQVRRTFLECAAAGDLDGAVRVVDAVVAEHGDDSFSEVLELGAHVLTSVSVAMHQHGTEED